MKKIFCAFLSAALILTCLCGCEKKKSDSNISVDSNGTISSTTGSGITFSFDYSEGLDENGFFKGIRALDYVTLPDYKNIEIPPETFVADEETVQSYVDTILSQIVEYEHIMDKTIEDGDKVNIDYVGYIDGVEFSGGSTMGNGVTITIGSTKYIDDFIDQLIGHKPGDRFDVNVTFPEDYGKEDLNGKDAVFDVTINYIQGEKIEPQLTDDIAKEYGYDTVDGFMAALHEGVILDQIQSYVYDLSTQAECSEIPQSVFDYVSGYELQYIYDQYSYDGMIDFGTILTSLGYSSVEDFRERQKDLIEEHSKFFLMLQAIAEAEGLEPTEEDMIEQGYDQYVESHGLAYVNHRLLEDVVIPNYMRQLAGQATE